MVIAWSEPTHRMAPGNLMDEESWNARRVHVADLELTAETVAYIIRRMLKDVTPEREQVEAFMSRTSVRS